jgi:hypothetical protein
MSKTYHRSTTTHWNLPTFIKIKHKKTYEIKNQFNFNDRYLK